MKEVKKSHNPYSVEEQMSYLREYLLSDENKLQFSKRHAHDLLKILCQSII